MTRYFIIVKLLISNMKNYYDPLYVVPRDPHCASLTLFIGQVFEGVNRLKHTHRYGHTPLE